MPLTRTRFEKKKKIHSDSASFIRAHQKVKRHRAVLFFSRMYIIASKNPLFHSASGNHRPLHTPANNT